MEGVSELGTKAPLGRIARAFDLTGLGWGDRGDLNPRPPGPQPGALTGLSYGHQDSESLIAFESVSDHYGQEGIGKEGC